MSQDATDLQALYQELARLNLRIYSLEWSAKRERANKLIAKFTKSLNCIFLAGFDVNRRLKIEQQLAKTACGIAGSFN